MKILGYVRNGPNYKLLDFFAYPDQSPENISKTQKYSAFVIQNVLSQKVTAGFWFKKKIQVMSEMD